MESKIDLVFPWVDGADPVWLEEKKKYAPSYVGDKRDNRYRDWDNLQYVFRGIEKYLPWIRKVHFITWGHVPAWLNEKNAKLHIVKHEEYIPKEYLPVFSANPIEMNLHRISDLAEQFIYMNDDMFFLDFLEPEDFFRDGLPCDAAVEVVHQFRKGGIDHIVANNLEIINANFNKKEALKKYRGKFYTVKYKKGLLNNLYLMPFGYFTGFENPHMPTPFLKSVLAEIWEKEPEKLIETSRNKFRSPLDVNQWLIRYWQFASGKFFPSKRLQCKFFSIGRDDKEIADAINNRSYKMICLSDDDLKVDFIQEKNFIKGCFDKILPEKSTFEK